MSARQRRQGILDLLEKQRTVYTSDLCDMYQVSAMTIRRDFERMAGEGLITILRGGAALNQGAAVLHLQTLKLIGLQILMLKLIDLSLLMR